MSKKKVKGKTKNFIKFKKTYVTGPYGDKHAPFTCEVSYIGFDPDFDSTLGELAKRNSGEEVASGYDHGHGNRDVSYDFFTEKGVRQFAKKIIERYGDKRDLEAFAYKTVIQVVSEDLE